MGRKHQIKLKYQESNGYILIFFKEENMKIEIDFVV